jgi:hypothetical protein
MHLPGDHSFARRRIATWQMRKPPPLLMLVAATTSEGEDSNVCEALLPRDISQRDAVVGMAWVVGARGVGGTDVSPSAGSSPTGTCSKSGDTPGLGNAHIASAHRVW